MLARNRTIAPLLLLGLTLMLLGAGFFFRQQPSGVEEQVALPFDASSPLLLLPAGGAHEWRFQATQFPLRGLILYAPAHVRPGKLHLTVINQVTGEHVRSWRYTTAVRGDSRKLIFLLPKLTARTKDVVVASLQNQAAWPLNLLTARPGTLAWSALQPIFPTWGLRQGFLAAGIASLLWVLIELLPLKRHGRWWAVRLVVLLLPVFAVSGFWWSSGVWGVGDWDYRFSLHHIYRQTIVTFHQFPWWNPYTCGGTAGLADPEFSVLSPTFLLELLFGIPLGTKLGLYLSLVILASGMLQLAKSLRYSWRGALLAALVTTYSSAYLLKAVEGHTTIIYAFMWIPWIFWSWLKAYRARTAPAPRLQQAGGVLGAGDGRSTRWSMVCGVFLALAFYQGGIYILSYTVLALAVLCLLVRHKRQAGLKTLLAGAWAVGLSALKLLPVLYWLITYPDQSFVPSANTLPYLTDIFLRRHPHGSYVLPGQQSGWHEYGAYVGFVVVGLALVGLVQARSRRLPRYLLLAGLLVVATASSGPLLQPVFNYLSFLPRSNISRINLFAVVALALLAGWGLDRLYRANAARRALVAVLFALVAADILTLGSTIADQAFVLPAVFPAPLPADWPLSYSTRHYVVSQNDQEHNRAYAATLAGYGSFSFCSVIGPPSRVATVTQSSTPPYVAPAGQASLTRWTPNSFDVAYLVPEPANVVINMNYAPGWQVNGRAAQNDTGRLAAVVGRGEGVLAFSYHPPLFFPGMVLTMVTIAAALYQARWSSTLPA